jgi:hypothetical protein
VPALGLNPRDVSLPGIFSANTGLAPICVHISAGRVRKGLPVDQGSGGEAAEAGVP